MLVMDGDREEEEAQATPGVQETAESGREEEVSVVERTDCHGRVRCSVQLECSALFAFAAQHVLLLDSYFVRVRASSGCETKRAVPSFSVFQGL
jgi:hypothetical protein